MNSSEPANQMPQPPHDGSHPAVNEGEAIYPGKELNWDSERVPVRLMVELPFWLLMPNSSLNLTVEGCRVPTTLINNGVEFQVGHQFTRTHEPTVFIGPIEAVQETPVSVGSLASGGLLRTTRTLLSFQTTAHSDALAAVGATGRRRQDGLDYFRSFAVGHLAFVNQLINSYRRVAVDPFSTEVSEWDVPVWFLEHDRRLMRIFLFPYQIEDTHPSLAEQLLDRAPQPYIAATPQQVELAGVTDGIPGEVELLDGWSLYYRGRYGDSIRSLVTAVEVLLEAKLRDALRSSGVSPEKAEERILQTRNNFRQRLDFFCCLTGQRVPGPLLSWVPYINGIRLTDEFEATRNLRHDIVHSGRRLDHSLIKPMRRAAETTTWFFDWLSGGPSGESDFAKRQSRHYHHYEQWRRRDVFRFDIRPEGVTVIPRQRPMAGTDEGELLIVNPRDIGDIPEKLFVMALHSDTANEADVEHFARMAFAKLNLVNVSDSPPIPSDALPYFDRYRVTHDGRLVLVFLLDTHEQISERNIEQIAAAVGIRLRLGLAVSAVLCIVNDQNGVPWELRVPASISEGCVQLAQACGISLVKTDDLARLALGVRQHEWSADVAFDSLIRPGWTGREPPGAEYVGKVRHFYAEPGIASIELSGGAKVAVGDSLAYRLRRRFHQQVVSSMQQNHQHVNEARLGNIGVPVSLTRSDLPIGAPVFLMPQQVAAQLHDQREGAKWSGPNDHKKEPAEGAEEAD